MNSRTRLVVRVVLLVLGVAVPVFAAAPLDQYESFDASTRFISDRFTRLTWERPSARYPDRMSYDDAVAHCESLGKYRIPTLGELLTIVDEEPHDEYDGTKNVALYIDQSAFPKTPPEEFWTSSSNDGIRMWTVDFATGETLLANQTDRRRIRCVNAR